MADAQASLGASVHLVDMQFQADAENGIPNLASFQGVPGGNATTVMMNDPNLSRVILDLGHSSKSNRTFFHDHGLWLPQNRCVAHVTSSQGWKLIVSPRGMLSSWSLNRRWLAKKVLWSIWQKAALKSAAGFHATSAEEASDIRKAGLSQPIAVIPNSVRFPDQLPTRKARSDGRGKLLFLSRIHPVKGVKELLTAFKQAGIEASWELSIVGPDEKDYGKEVRKHAQDLGLDSSVFFEGAVDDHEKWQRYVNADLFILPSFSENFGIVIAEAMAAGLPVITTTGTPWSCLKDLGLGWWVEPTVAGLRDALTESTSCSAQALKQMGIEGSAYVRRQFSWQQSAQEMLEFYRSL
jgi:glycosyltransferase involved in cell wall biosynthesis